MKRIKVRRICLTKRRALDFGYGKLIDDEIQDGDSSELVSADKRYARLSYFRQPKSRYRWGYRRSRYSSSRNHWDYLPDRNCFRNRCRSKYDCCKRYSTCDPSAKICYDCWYGHPCSRNSDCCMRFPRCSAATMNTLVCLVVLSSIMFISFDAVEHNRQIGDLRIRFISGTFQVYCRETGTNVEWALNESNTINCFNCKCSAANSGIKCTGIGYQDGAVPPTGCMKRALQDFEMQAPVWAYGDGKRHEVYREGGGCLRHL
ncbi:hypothetical protein LOTGIDRAFT_237130 [Lottia gigantea]|uniref:Uncharacterized protein n=1 Tax=Lottia gigantea TaxID=225164 RepID=V3YVW5_LOTGI|nr:hypothetical protein LOTGIDRAFT_237130 [Lottia gigantea]ESO82143.1 hypothetical protein LOTGIDRAFT_237130 [Lottia gigantea]